MNSTPFEPLLEDYPTQQEKMLIQFNDDDDFEQNFQVIKSTNSKSVTERTKRIYQPNINASFNIRLL